jgi:hypothetical protein
VAPHKAQMHQGIHLGSDDKIGGWKGRSQQLWRSRLWRGCPSLLGHGVGMISWWGVERGVARQQLEAAPNLEWLPKLAWLCLRARERFVLHEPQHRFAFLVEAAAECGCRASELHCFPAHAFCCPLGTE